MTEVEKIITPRAVLMYCATHKAEYSMINLVASDYVKNQPESGYVYNKIHAIIGSQASWEPHEKLRKELQQKNEDRKSTDDEKFTVEMLDSLAEMRDELLVASTKPTRGRKHAHGANALRS